MNSFYLGSMEGYLPDGPYRGEIVKRISYGQRDDLALVTLTPPLKGSDYNLNIGSIDSFILAPRHLGKSIFETDDWPISVYVVLVPEYFDNGDVIDGRLEPFIWGEIYLHESEALKYQ